MTLSNLREDIDRLDARLLALIEERMEKALLTRRFKAGVEDGQRETAILERVARASRCLVDPEFSTGIWKTLMAGSKALQARGLSTLGFQGEHGAYGEMAARAWKAEAATLPCHEFGEVFDNVRDGVFDYGIVPVENTLGGLVGPVNAILTFTDLRIVGAIDLQVSHCLMALPGSDHREIRAALSHPQALAQCRGFLERNSLEARDCYDTAGAARKIAAERLHGVAALASRFAAELYDLEIIKEDVQDAPVNRTRFLVLAREDSGVEGSKCSAVFSTEDKAGALFRVLEIFARAGLNLTRIESVPRKPGDYAIFVDFEGSDRESGVARAIAEASACAQDFRLLGCYDEKRVG